MYKLLLCWRYLLTRYIALASIISVMLGVATMIVVNAVMLGFTTKMQDQLHGLLSDVTFESWRSEGFPDPQWHMNKINSVAGDMIEAMTPMIHTPAMMTYRVGGQPMSRPVQLIGIDTETQGNVSDFFTYLQHPENREKPSFQLRNGGYDVKSAGKGGRTVYRHDMESAGWDYRRYNVAVRERLEREYEARKEQQRLERLRRENPSAVVEDDAPEMDWGDDIANVTQENIFNPAKEQHAGAIIGVGLSSVRRTDRDDPETGEMQILDRLALIPGDDIQLTFPASGLPVKLQTSSFTVVDLYESKMTDYDQQFIFVPIEKLQQYRGMYDPGTGEGMVTRILIKANPGADIDVLRDRIRAEFPEEMFCVTTWRDQQAPLLNAVYNELAMLNVLLFLIFAVAGFGILAIFYTIVVEKKKDIGIMKSLGAGGWGVMQIFVYYSLLLGIVGSLMGLGLGFLLVYYINEVAGALSFILRSEVFNPDIYFFYEIPTIIQTSTVLKIISGAIAIAVASGVLPAVLASRMHPVESLRA